MSVLTAQTGLALVDDHESDPRLIVAHAIPFHSLCMHHLLPFRGLAHVGYRQEFLALTRRTSP